jgi:hypothetical protein
MCGSRGNICVLCGDKLSVDCKIKRRRAAFMSGEEDNLLMRRFFEGAHIPEGRLSLLSVPALHHVNRRRNFSKEFTDSLGIFFALHQTLVQLGLSSAPIRVVDLCCGKGFTAALVGAAFPNASVIAVDKIRNAYLPHYAEAGLGNVRYEQIDILSDAFIVRFREIVEGEGRMPVVVLGMHLCGALSLRAVELLAEPGVRAVLVAPCCLPGRKSQLAMEIFEGCEKDRKFEHWCDHLERLMLQTRMGAPPLLYRPGGDEGSGTVGLADPPLQAAKVNRLEVQGMIAQKNTILSAIFAM